MNITLNSEENLFVIKSSDHYSCLGFQVVFERAKELANRLVRAGKSVVTPNAAEIGTVQQYAQYLELLGIYGTIQDTETWYDSRTAPYVVKVLERCRKAGNIIRVFYGNTETGQCWLEENDVIGKVGRSTGPMKSPLLVPEGDCGGGAILTDCILRILDVLTGQELYRHPRLQMPRFVIDEDPASSELRYCAHTLESDGTRLLQARFNSMGEAAHWVAFMLGDSFDYKGN